MRLGLVRSKLILVSKGHFEREPIDLLKGLTYSFKSTFSLLAVLEESELSCFTVLGLFSGNAGSGETSFPSDKFPDKASNEVG